VDYGLVSLEGSAAAEIRALVPEVLEARRFFIGRADPELFPAAWTLHGCSCPRQAMFKGWATLPFGAGFSGTYFILVALIEEGTTLLVNHFNNTVRSYSIKTDGNACSVAAQA
jgi:hypothetical protein